MCVDGTEGYVGLIPYSVQYSDIVTSVRNSGITRYAMEHSTHLRGKTAPRYHTARTTARLRSRFFEWRWLRRHRHKLRRGRRRGRRVATADISSGRAVWRVGRKLTFGVDVPLNPNEQTSSLESPPDVLRSDGLDQQLMLVKQDAVLPLVRPRA